ncbi:MAG TPA: FCD domain-containing protein [Roseiflexaceae bacterium]|jgi:GntR family transcriptional repressor for pyruvate dehydrogenase complex|nr:FCD domain-containing protein [Roseiflexaceae bacterium]
MDIIHDDIFMTIRSPNPLEETMERISGVIKARLLNPGDRLPPERELAARLGVSRSTLRVALQNLVEAGWLEVRRGRHGGSFVARWPDLPGPRRVPEILTRHSSDLPALLDYRRAIESAASGFAAERALPVEIMELEALAKATQYHEADHERTRAADTRFHIGVARAAHSPLLMHALMQISEVMSEVIDTMIYHSPDVLKNAAEYHQRIVEAIRIHDAETARRLMLEHVIATESVIYSMIPESARCNDPRWVQRSYGPNTVN